MSRKCFSKQCTDDESVEDESDITQKKYQEAMWVYVYQCCSKYHLPWGQNNEPGRWTWIATYEICHIYGLFIHKAGCDSIFCLCHVDNGRVSLTPIGFSNFHLVFICRFFSPVSLWSTLFFVFLNSSVDFNIYGLFRGNPCLLRSFFHSFQALLHSLYALK